MERIKVQNKPDLTILVDDEDYLRVSEYNWYARYSKKSKTYYALRGKNEILPFIYMHRFIMNVIDRKIIIDHKNHNGLDNRKENLRICTYSQNSANSCGNRNASSIYKGVTKCKRRWRAQIIYEHKYYHLGLYLSEIEAAKAYNEKAKELHGEFAFINTFGN